MNEHDDRVLRRELISAFEALRENDSQQGARILDLETDVDANRT